MPLIAFAQSRSKPGGIDIPCHPAVSHWQSNESCRMPDVRPETAPKQNLVVVRAGENSLHPGWLNHDNNPYNFDLLISYFSQAAYENHKNAPGVRAVLVRGGKWDGLFKTLSGLANLDQYDFVWLPDDDIATDGATIETMFALAAEFELGVCQPALSHDSFYSHFIFNQCRAFKLRYVNYVEIMVPCLSRRVLRHALPLFENSMSGFGLDNIWCRLAGKWNVRRRNLGRYCRAPHPTYRQPTEGRNVQTPAWMRMGKKTS